MIALGPVSVRIGRAYYRLNHGQQVPDELEQFWRRNKQIESLVKANAISEKDAAKEKKVDKKSEKKSEKIDKPVDIPSDFSAEDIGEAKE